MIVSIRILFVIISTIAGPLLADLFKIDTLSAGLLGFFGSVSVVLLEIISKRISLKDIIAASFGLIFGLIIASLLSYAVVVIPLIKDKNYIPIIFYLIFGYLGISIGIIRRNELTFLNRFFNEDKKSAIDKIIDTSVIIDGRIADIVNTGFVEGELLIPNFVLQELQHVADSQDPLKRTRGRRGLEILKILKESNKVKIVDKDIPEISKVDEKLVAIAKSIDAIVITNDYNLNRVAKIHGVEILNINDLATAVKPIVLPSETLSIKVIKEGKEHGQGLAYLDDGTMIVVENGKNLIGKTIDSVVTSILQTSSGRIIFAKKKGDSD